MKLLLTLGFICTVLNPTHAMADSATAPVRINLHSAKYFSQIDYDRLMAATHLVETIINSQEFKDRILNFTYAGTKAFVQNNGLTNAQIYDELMTGAEKFPTQTAEDRLMDYDLQLYTPSWRQSKNVIGYTNQNTLTIFINRVIYQKTEVYKIAMNLVHEWTHKMGYDHDFKATARRPASVPYAVGYMVRDMGKALTGETGDDSTADGGTFFR